MSLEPQAKTLGPASPVAGAWGAVGALTLCVSALIASEFMPVSLLTPIATDLRISEGQAGQAIAVSGVFAVLASLAISSATRTLDRRHVLLGLTGMMVLSGLVVALAPNVAVFMAGRALVGVVIGGFWSMSAATVMRLVPRDQAPRALAALNGGNALATTLAAPLGSFLGQYIGWRGAFFLVVPLGLVTLAWQWLSLPAMPPHARTGRNVFRVLRGREARAGFVAVALLFAGQFTLFTYLRPFLESVTKASVSGLSLILLGLGLSGLVGTWLIGRLLPARLYGLLVAAPAGLAIIAIGLIALGGSPGVVALLLMGWGLIGVSAPVAWWTWVASSLPEDAEAGGGLMVATVQLAITVGAALGGALVDTQGYRAAFAASAAILVAAALLAVLTTRLSIAKVSP